MTKFAAGWQRANFNIMHQMSINGKAVGKAWDHLSRCVTLARATAKACIAVNGYWKSSV